MSGFNKFKTRTGRKERVVHPDGSFRKGMKFTEGFIPPQTVKMLVNHRIMANGTYITPRNGINGRDTFIKTVPSNDAPPVPHVVYYGMYRDFDGFDKKGKIVLSFGVPSGNGYEYYFTDPTTLPDDYYDMTFINNGYAFGTLDTENGVYVSNILDTTGLASARCKFFKQTPHPVYTILNHYLYYMGVDSDGVDQIFKVEIVYDSVSSKYKAVSIPVIGKEVSVGEATSIGFNMLEDEPFFFENEPGIVLSTIGILPYSPSSPTHLKMSANLGDKIKFITYYRYVSGVTYRAKWEYASAMSSEFTTIHDYMDATYVNGQEISVVVDAMDTKFTLRCTIVPLSGGEMQDVLSKVAIYPVYTLGIGDLKDISPVNYNLPSAKYMSTHNEMMVLWGVPGLESTLFFSDVLDPEYFPFPHNTYNFLDEILHVESFAGALFIFTSNTLYLLEGFSIYEMGYPVAVYDNLSFTKEDMFSVRAVKNGLFVRSKGKYYMFVPNVYTGSLSDIRLLPISDAIEELVDDPKSYLKLLSDRLYNFNVTWGENTKVYEYDFINYVDGASVKNIHRFVVYEDKLDFAGDIIGRVRYQIDAILVYNTESFIWTTEVASFPFHGITPHSNSLYTSHYRKGASESDLFLEKLTYSNKTCRDTYNTMYYGEAMNDRPTSAREQQLALFPVTGFDTVIRVIDGDTVELETLGIARFLYINTPESTVEREPYGLESSNFLSGIIQPGAVVRFEFDGDRADSYDRALVWLFTNEGLLLQEMIAREGYVQSIYDFGASKYVSEVQDALSEAVEYRRNLYANLYVEGPYYVRNLQTSNLLGNFQILDTGNCDHNSYMEKRYKEIQFLMSNDSSNVLRFYTEFFVDSRKRQTFLRYEIEQNTDATSPDFGTIFITPVEEPNITLTNETELGFWELDLSEFPSLDVVKVVFRISGKGHYPRFVLVSRNQDPYKIINYSWVYRTLNAR